MAVERAGEPEHRAAEGERLDLERERVLAGDRGGLLVVADRAQHAPERRMGEPVDQREGDDHQRRHQA